MSSVVTLSPSVRNMVDTRLDSIERVLLAANVSRAERREIIQSVEYQILELAGRDGDTEPTRDRMLSILKTIDPPEAYFPADLLPEDRCHMLWEDRANPSRSNQRAPRFATLAIVSCILGLVSFFSVPWVPLFAVFGLAATNSGSVALSQIHYSGGLLKGVWPAIVGVAAPIVGMVVLFVLVSM